MSWDPDEEDTTVYKVVINHEEQYSIWPQDRENALGWFDVGKEGLKQECLDHIEEVWTDMRPLSLQRKMLEDQVEQKFGSVDAAATKKIESATSAQVNKWTAQLESADNQRDVFD